MSPEVSKSRILVVDDDAGMVRAVTRVLGRQHEVLAASSGAEALRQAASFQPEVAILDIRMPGMNGFELMQRLNDEWPDVDVILMTGSVAESDANLVRAIDEGAFYFIHKPFDRRVLQTLVGRCLELRRLRQDKQRHLRRLERELAEARQFQLSLLPPRYSRLQGISITARYIACTELAGDFYDYAPAGEDQIAILIADVSGHGTPAAMLTGVVKSAFHAAHVDGYDPLAVVRQVYDSIRAFDPRRFVTLFSGRISTARPELTYVSAGHPPALLWRRGRAPDLLGSTGPLISSGFGDLPWEACTVPLTTDDRLLLYTDGVVEARGGDGMFGRGRIEQFLRSSDGQEGSALLDGLLADISTFSGSRPHADDMTLLAVEFGGDP